MRRKKRDRRGRALRSLALALGLYLCFQWAAGYRLLPQWVRGLAQDDYGAGRTHLAVDLGAGITDRKRNRFYLAAGEETVLFFAARHTPLLGWGLAGDAAVGRRQRGAGYETLTVGGFTLEREETHDQECWVFGEVTDRKVAEVVLYGAALPEGWGPEDLGYVSEEDWSRLKPMELVRLGPGDWLRSQGRCFFVWNHLLAVGGARSWWWTYIESYDAAGTLLERIYVGNWGSGRFQF